MLFVAILVTGTIFIDEVFTFDVIVAKVGKNCPSIKGAYL